MYENPPLLTFAILMWNFNLIKSNSLFVKIFNIFSNVKILNENKIIGGCIKCRLDQTGFIVN